MADTSSIFVVYGIYGVYELISVPWPVDQSKLRNKLQYTMASSVIPHPAGLDIQTATLKGAVSPKLSAS